VAGAGESQAPGQPEQHSKVLTQGKKKKLNSENILKTIKLHPLHGRIVCGVNCISINKAVYKTNKTPNNNIKIIIEKKRYNYPLSTTREMS
jgi:hypothetical protein